MSDTPIYDVEAEFARILREYGGLGEGAWAAAKWYAEALVRSRDVLERQLANTYKGYQACNDDLIKCDAEVMRWFKAASPYATPGSLEQGLKKLREELIEECALICESRAGSQATAAFRILMSAADAIRQLKS
jgi:hypothetical protein